MSSPKSSPCCQFRAIIWALGVFISFALVLGMSYLLFANKNPKTLEDELAKKRYILKQQTAEEQEKFLSSKAIEVAIPAAAKSILATKVVAASAAPASAVAVVTAPSADKLENGKMQYMLCAACHGQNGEGTDLGPMFKNSEWVKGPVENLIRILLRGLAGPIVVNGKEFVSAAGMPQQSFQTDDQIAAVLTYIRYEFGDKASEVTADQVKALRGEVGQAPMTANDLVKP